MSKPAPIVAASATIALVNIPMLQGRAAAASAKFGSVRAIRQRGVTLRFEYALSAIQIKLPEQSK
jgi:hypothetical protein